LRKCSSWEEEYEKEPSEKSVTEWGYSRPENGAEMAACCQAQQTEKDVTKFVPTFVEKVVLSGNIM
jgi:hypothetical protein